MLNRPRFYFVKLLCFLLVFPIILKHSSYYYVMVLTPSFMAFVGFQWKEQGVHCNLCNLAKPALGDPRFFTCSQPHSSLLLLKTSIVFYPMHLQSKNWTRINKYFHTNMWDVLYTIPLHSGSCSINHSYFCSSPKLYDAARPLIKTIALYSGSTFLH